MEIHNLAYTTHLEKLWKFIDETNKKVEFRRQFLLLRADCRDSTLEKADDEILLEMPLFAFFRETPYPTVFTGKDFKEKINGVSNREKFRIRCYDFNFDFIIDLFSMFFIHSIIHLYLLLLCQ